MTFTNINLKKTISQIWNLLDSPEKKIAKYFVCLSVVATVLEMLSLGMIVPLLYAFTSTSHSLHSGILGYVLNVSWVKNISLTYILILLVILFVIKNSFLIFLMRFQARFVFGIEESVSNRIYAIYLNQLYPFFLKKNSAELLRNVMREPSQFAHNALSPLCLLISELFISLGIITLLVIVNPLAAIGSILLFGGLGYIFYAFVHKKISRWGQEHQFHEGKRLQNLQEGFGSVKEILIASLQGKFTTAYASHMRAGINAGVNQQSVQAIPRLFIETFTVIMLTGSVWFFGQLDPINLLPIIGLYAAAAFRLLPGVNRIINALQSLRYSESTVHLLALELARTELVIPESAGDDIVFDRSIELRNLSFRHEDSTPYLLDNVNLKIDVGDTILLVGPSGVGKTTLVDIICGLQKPVKGELLVDGLNVFQRISSWQKNIAYVPQTTFLMDGTIKENIIFGRNDHEIDHQHLKFVCEITKVDEITRALPNGLNSKVSERGANLSGGQRQRIGLARALYRGGKLLVLDEATNALDSSLEKVIIEALLLFASKNKMTIICITHNPKFISSGYKKLELSHAGVSISYVAK